MADTTTTNYGWTQPESGTNGWDAKLNSSLEAIDSDLNTVDARTNFATTTLTLTDLGIGSESAQNWAHGLGTDNIDYGFSVTDEGTIGNKLLVVTAAMDALGFAQQNGPTGSTQPTDPVSYAQRPAAGNIRFGVRNNSGDSTNTIKIKVWARAR